MPSRGRQRNPRRRRGRPATRRKALRIAALVVVTIAALWGIWYFLTQAGRVSTDARLCRRRFGRGYRARLGPVKEVRRQHPGGEEGRYSRHPRRCRSAHRACRCRSCAAAGMARGGERQCRCRASARRLLALAGAVAQARARLRDADAAVAKARAELARREEIRLEQVRCRAKN